MSIEVMADFRCGCAERPLWHPQLQRLYYTDVDRPAMYAFDAVSGQASKVYTGDDVVGGMTMHHDGRLLLFMSGAAVRLWCPKEGSLETVSEPLSEESDSRFNDVFADPQGRVFCGTMPTQERPGRLYRWDPDGQLHLVLEQAGLPNGMGLSPDGQTFYFTDTEARTIDAFDYDEASGRLSRRRTVVRPPSGEPGNPDGLAVDSEGRLWSAFYGGHRVVCYSPQGEELSRIPLPMAENPTCPLLVEPGWMYLTTAGGDHRPQAGEAAGALLRLRVEASPLPAFLSGTVSS